MVRVGVEWINQFPSPCSQNTLDWCDETSEGFMNGMVSRGHSNTFDWGDSNAWERDFRDTANGGDDSNWIDAVDFAHFSSHGSTTSSNVFMGFFGGRTDNCTWASNQARFGDNWNLEWLAIDACNSLELTRDVIATWHQTFAGLHQIFAFTDLVSDGSSTSDRGYRFGRRAGNNEPLGDAWLDECFSAAADDNPVAMAAGRTLQDAENRLDNERINSGFDDIPHDQVEWYAWKWRE